MPDFLLELLSEEIPARMQAKAQEDLARLFAAEVGKAGLYSQGLDTYATPRRLVLIARGLPEASQPVAEEMKGPRTSAPPQALEGFLRKTGLLADQLEDRGGIWFARIEQPGRATAAVLAEAIPAIVRAFPWPKSMRWGAASLSTESPRWVRPLQGIVALFGEDIVEVEIAGIRSGAATVGHRFHHPGPITIGGAHDYLEKLRACHVIVDAEERRQLIRDGAARLAAEAGLSLIPDEGLVAENAGLTEWPMPLLGRFDESFLQVPREVIQLTMRTNQKYFSLTKSSPSFARGGGPPPEAVVEGPAPTPPSALRAATSPSKLGEDLLAPNFICTANIDASDGGAAIVAGNERVLSARLSDAKFFWEQDLKVPLESQAEKLRDIVFHEKLGTVADKVDRVAKLARWLVEEGIVTSKPLPFRGGVGGGDGQPGTASDIPHPNLSPEGEREHLATLAERAARLCKADLVTGLVGEFPELQGIIGGHLARAQGEHPEVAAAIRDHYKPVGQGDEVPTDSVTVAVSLADKLDTITAFFGIDEKPTGSKDPFALRRAALGVIRLITDNRLRMGLRRALIMSLVQHGVFWWNRLLAGARRIDAISDARMQAFFSLAARHDVKTGGLGRGSIEGALTDRLSDEEVPAAAFAFADMKQLEIIPFFGERLAVQQREAGVRHDLIDAVFALGGEDDLVRLLARVKALQAFVETPEGADLLAGYKRAANILKKEGWAPTHSPSPLAGEGQGRGATQGEGLALEEEALTPTPHPVASQPPSPARGEGQKEALEKTLSYTPLPEESSLHAALDAAEPRARAAVEREDFEAAMAALATIRAPVDAFFDKVTVNDPDPAKRAARLALLARMRDAVHQVADFSRIEG